MESTNSEIDFSCPHCGQQYSVDPSMIGHSTRCQNCGKIMMISVPGRQKVSMPRNYTRTRDTESAPPAKQGFQMRDFALGALTTAIAFIAGILLYQKGVIKITPANKTASTPAVGNTHSSYSPSSTTTKPVASAPTSRVAQPPKPEIDPGAELYKEAMRYYNGGDVLQDYTKAVELLIKASEKGSPEADGQLAFIYLTGNASQKRDAALAVSYARKAGNRKTLLAHQMLGEAYLFGVDNVLQQDFSAAYSEFLLASEDYYYSMFVAGLMRYHGVGTKEDKKGAAELFFSACKNRPKNSHAGMAALCLGHMYVKGEGVGQNMSEGGAWLRWGMKTSGRDIIRTNNDDLGSSFYMQYLLQKKVYGFVDEWPGDMTLLRNAIYLYYHGMFYR